MSEQRFNVTHDACIRSERIDHAVRCHGSRTHSTLSELHSIWFIYWVALGLWRVHSMQEPIKHVMRANLLVTPFAYVRPSSTIVLAIAFCSKSSTKNIKLMMMTVKDEWWMGYSHLNSIESIIIMPMPTRARQPTAVTDANTCNVIWSTSS